MLISVVYLTQQIKTNIMTADLAQYETQIQEIALFAKRINYNIENGIDELMKLWLQDGLKFQNFVQDNKKEFISVTKQFLK
jgi:dihydroorotase